MAKGLPTAAKNRQKGLDAAPQEVVTYTGNTGNTGNTRTTAPQEHQEPRERLE